MYFLRNLSLVTKHLFYVIGSARLSLVLRPVRVCCAVLCETVYICV